MEKKRAVLCSGLVIFVFCLIEFIGGFISKSLALTSDAGHMLIDLIPLVGAYLAMVMVKRKSINFSFGYKNLEPLVGMIGGVVLSLFLIFEIGSSALQRLWHGSEMPDVLVMFMIGLVGFIANYFAGNFLHNHKEDNLAIKGAFINNQSDMFLSGVVMISAVITEVTQQGFWDPILSLGMAGFLLYDPIRRLLMETGRVLLLGVPDEIDINEIRGKISKIRGVDKILDDHYWSMGGKFGVADFHIMVKPEIGFYSGERIKIEISEILKRSGIKHLTVQLENPEIKCFIAHC